MSIEKAVFRKIEAKFGFMGTFEQMAGYLRGEGALVRELDLSIEQKIAEFRWFINGVTAADNDLPVAYACQIYLKALNHRGELAKVKRFIKTGRGSAALAEKRLTKLVSAILYVL